MIEIQLAQRLAQDTWRINRVHAIEENIFALGHSEPYAKIDSAHPEITFRTDPKLFSYLASYEQKLTRNFHVNRGPVVRFVTVARGGFACRLFPVQTRNSFCEPPVGQIPDLPSPKPLGQHRAVRFVNRPSVSRR